MKEYTHSLSLFTVETTIYHSESAMNLQWISIYQSRVHICAVQCPFVIYIPF